MCGPGTLTKAMVWSLGHTAVPLLGAVFSAAALVVVVVRIKRIHRHKVLTRVVGPMSVLCCHYYYYREKTFCFTPTYSEEELNYQMFLSMCVGAHRASLAECLSFNMIELRLVWF